MNKKSKTDGPALRIYMDSSGKLFKKTPDGDLKLLPSLPQEYEDMYYIKFVQANDMDEQFGPLNITGAMDLYLK
ncbi:hypothetical protein [Maribacter sp. 2-571]|uniref:hypothetical protein n=1 Tax=Maribacter sp. 2-571 TaxID=3417569 RepID=UPI003D356DB8